MAKARQRQGKNATTVTTTTVTGGGGRRSRRRSVRRRNNGSNPPTVKTTTVRTVPQRTPRARRNQRRVRPRSRQLAHEVVQTVTATLGTVSSNQGDTVELEMAALLSPALVKETTGSNAFGPLQMCAATYALWKVDSLHLRLTPLVGASAVSGTAVRASLNMTGAPATPSWSALGARRHVDTNPGRSASWTLTARDIPGPKNGWFYTNTKQEAGFSVGGSIEIHTLGKTMSTYKNEAYTGPLFLAEVTGTWRFKNYEPQPGLLNLVKTQVTEPAGTVKLHSKPGEPVTLSIPEGSTFAGLERLPVQASATPSEIIWEVVDSAAKIVTGALPEPWSWLFKSGWFFLKRIANKKPIGAPTVVGEADGGEVTFKVFASIADAQNDVPCIATSQAETVSKDTQGMVLSQVTPGNIGMPETALATRAGGPAPAVAAYEYVGTMLSNSTGQPITSLWGVFDTTHQQQTGIFPGNSSTPDNTACWSMCTVQVDEDGFEQNGFPITPDDVAQGSFPISVYVNNNEGITQLGTAIGVNDYRARTTGNDLWVVSATNVLWRCTRTDNWSSNGFNSHLWMTTKKIVDGPAGQQRPPSVVGGLSQTNNTAGGHGYRCGVTAGRLYITSWLQFSPDSWLTYQGVNFPKQPETWQSSNPNWDITTEALLAGLWGSSRLRFYPIGTQPPPAATGSSRSRFDLPEGEGSDTEDDDTDYLTDTSASEDQQEAPAEDDLEHFCKPPPVVMRDLTYAGRNLSNELWSRGVPDAKAWEAGQAADPSPSFRRWQKSFMGALERGCLPAKAHELATSEFKAQRESRGHAE